MDTAGKSRWIAVATVLLLTVLMMSCAQDSGQSVSGQSVSTDSPTLQEASPPAKPTATDAFSEAREQMVISQLATRDIVDPRVLETMRRVPRHRFVPANVRANAYDDCPLPIGKGQTISQPYIVALMTQLVDPKPKHKALDIGTGSGYQAAVLAELVKEVYSIEIVEPLANQARTRLKNLGYLNIDVRHGDGYRGWPSEAPFDVIIVAAAPDHIPPALIAQLAPGGKLVIPVGENAQSLIVVHKQPDGTVVKRNVAPVAFVPMTGEARK